MSIAWRWLKNMLLERLKCKTICKTRRNSWQTPKPCLTKSKADTQIWNPNGRCSRRNSKLWKTKRTNKRAKDATKAKTCSFRFLKRREILKHMKMPLKKSLKSKRWFKSSKSNFKTPGIYWRTFRLNVTKAKPIKPRSRHSINSKFNSKTLKSLSSKKTTKVQLQIKMILK